MRRPTTFGVLLAAIVTVIALDFPVEAQSRHRSGHRTGYYGHVYYPRVRTYGYFGSRFYSPYFYPSFGLYYGRPFYGGYYPYYGPYSVGSNPWASIRIEVKPREAMVYVDGYYAGVVDDYDGVFQRLNLAPGNHEIVVYSEGYRTISQTMYVSPGSSYRIRQEMVPLLPGESQEQPQQAPELEAPPRGPGPPAEVPSSTMPPPTPPPVAAVQTAPATDFGILEVRVQPGDVRLLIDGEPWTMADATDPVSIHLAEGRHRVDIEKEGYRSFSGNVVVRSGRTTTLNVKLSSSAERDGHSPRSVL